MTCGHLQDGQGHASCREKHWKLHVGTVIKFCNSKLASVLIKVWYWNSGWEQATCLHRSICEIYESGLVHFIGNLRHDNITQSPVPVIPHDLVSISASWLPDQKWDKSLRKENSVAVMSVVSLWALAIFMCIVHYFMCGPFDPEKRNRYV